MEFVPLVRVRPTRVFALPRQQYIPLFLAVFVCAYSLYYSSGGGKDYTKEIYDLLDSQLVVTKTFRASVLSKISDLDNELAEVNNLLNSIAGDTASITDPNFIKNILDYFIKQFTSRFISSLFAAANPIDTIKDISIIGKNLAKIFDIIRGKVKFEKYFKETIDLLDQIKLATQGSEDRIIDLYKVTQDIDCALHSCAPVKAQSVPKIISRARDFLHNISIFDLPPIISNRVRTISRQCLQGTGYVSFLSSSCVGACYVSLTANREYLVMRSCSDGACVLPLHYDNNPREFGYNGPPQPYPAPAILNMKPIGDAVLAVPVFSADSFTFTFLKDVEHVAWFGSFEYCDSFVRNVPTGVEFKGEGFYVQYSSLYRVKYDSTNGVVSYESTGEPVISVSYSPIRKYDCQFFLYLPFQLQVSENCLSHNMNVPNALALDDRDSCISVRGNTQCSDYESPQYLASVSSFYYAPAQLFGATDISGYNVTFKYNVDEMEYVDVVAGINYLPCNSTYQFDDSHMDRWVNVSFAFTSAALSSNFKQTSICFA
ncbi:hypothetical protein [Wenling hepe-like virus 4]|uniref:hypothetical protein n=1 Tax=Wenling hepe-like virus 4 TaxID=1923496 RepID=UPI00090C911B|nr:hypothetical protein [Wenling hepe-like virus 4]APG77818.1 hypothetical protein [Wenling hepe-like virus 4]